MPAAPVVTGLSPKEGPPGTKVTIRGENLGKNPNDLIGEKMFLKTKYNEVIKYRKFHLLSAENMRM